MGTNSAKICIVIASKIHLYFIDEGRGDGAEGRGRGEDYHHGQVSLVRKPPKKQFGARPLNSLNLIGAWRHYLLHVPAPRGNSSRRASLGWCESKGSTICPMSEIVCFLVLIFTYSHVENSLFFALDLAVSL